MHALVPDVFIARPVCFLSAAGRLLGCLRARKILAVEEPKVRCVEFACLRTHSRDVCFSNLSKYVRAPIHYQAEHQRTHSSALCFCFGGPALQIKTSRDGAHARINAECFGSVINEEANTVSSFHSCAK
jgi:hypothetical protein